MAPGPNVPTSWLILMEFSAIGSLVSIHDLAVGIGDLHRRRMLDIAHRTTGPKVTVERVEAVKHWIKRIVQQRPLLRIAVWQVLGVGLAPDPAPAPPRA
jgi:hypothetical protein